MITQKRKLQIANICYANVAGDFAYFTNTTNRGPHFTWDKFIARCEENADLWFLIGNIRLKPDEKLLAKEYAADIADTLIRRAS